MATVEPARTTAREDAPRPMPSEPITMIKAIAYTLDQEMARNPNVIVLGEDVGRRGGVFLATQGLLERYGPDRVIDTPLAEGAIVGAAVGMASQGLCPVAEIQFADYVYPGFDQITTQMAKLRYRSGGQFSTPMTLRMPSGGGVGGGQHHSQSPEALFVHTPGLQTVMPSTPTDAVGLLRSAMRGRDPVIFFEPKRLYRAIKETVPADIEFTVPIGQAVVRRAGSDVTLISYGACMLEVAKAAGEMERAGVSAEVIDLRSLLPWDRNTVFESIAKTGRVVIVAEAPGKASVASEIAASIAESCLDRLVAPPMRVTGFDTPYPYAQDKLYLPSVTRILNAAKYAIDY